MRAVDRLNLAQRDVLEVGSRDVNGSARQIIEGLGPRTYVGVDLSAGPGVDELVAAGGLVDRFGVDRFDLVVSTEVLEHVEDWRTAVSAMKRVTKPGGAILVTTRSWGFGYHGFPHDYWRFETIDMQVLFGDVKISMLEHDTASPGIFLLATKPVGFTEADLSGHHLRSVLTRRRERQFEPRHLLEYRVRSTLDYPYRLLLRHAGQYRRSHHW